MFADAFRFPCLCNPDEGFIRLIQILQIGDNRAVDQNFRRGDAFSDISDASLNIDRHAL
jgi:hypothetical protein